MIGDSEKKHRSKKKQLCFSLSGPLLEFLEMEAEKLSVSRNEYLEHLVWKDFDQKLQHQMLEVLSTTA